MNLASVLCQTKQFEAARSSVLAVLRFNPDLGRAKTLLAELDASPPRCGP
jgi:hypothetical protein